MQARRHPISFNPELEVRRTNLFSSSALVLRILILQSVLEVKRDSLGCDQCLLWYKLLSVGAHRRDYETISNTPVPHEPTGNQAAPAGSGRSIPHGMVRTRG